MHSDLVVMEIDIIATPRRPESYRIVAAGCCRIETCGASPVLFSKPCCLSLNTVVVYFDVISTGGYSTDADRMFADARDSVIMNFNVLLCVGEYAVGVSCDTSYTNGIIVYFIIITDLNTSLAAIYNVIVTNNIISTNRLNSINTLIPVFKGTYVIGSLTC